MNKQPKIPDAETRARNVESLREVCRGFDAVNLLFDEVIVQLEKQNSRQRQERLDGKYRRVEEKVTE
jgi:hypothetical protein